MNKWCKIFLRLSHGVVSGSIEGENGMRLRSKWKKENIRNQ